MENKLLVIHQLRSEGKTLKQIGKTFHISAERVRQILVQKQATWCFIHKFYFDRVCYKCEQKKQDKKIALLLKWNGLDKEVKLLAKNDRSKEIVLSRRTLIKKLHNKHKISFRKIGKLLKRDHSSVMNLYYQ